MTAVPARLLRGITARDGKVCAWHGHGCGEDTLVPHHRSNRGMGGDRSKNRLSNLVWIDHAVHGSVWLDDAGNMVRRGDRRAG